MNRRKFVKISIIILTGSLVVHYLIRFQNVVKRILLNDTMGKIKNKNNIDLFITDATNEGYWNTFSTSKKLFISAHYFFELIGIRLPMSEKYQQARNKITGQFLLSTNLFKGSQMWDNKEIKYISFYNPYKQACSNPFSSIFFDA